MSPLIQNNSHKGIEGRKDGDIKMYFSSGAILFIVRAERRVGPKLQADLSHAALDQRKSPGSKADCAH